MAGLSVILPLLLLATSTACFVPGSLIQLSNLGFFYATVIVGLVLPTLASQYFRHTSPVETAKHAARWKVVPGLAYCVMAVVAGYQSTPFNLFFWFQTINAADGRAGNDNFNTLQPLTYAFAVWVALRAMAQLAVVLLPIIGASQHCVGHRRR